MPGVNFGGLVVGSKVQGFRIEPRRVEEASIRRCLFQTSVTIRDPYPARYLEHTLLVYNEAADVSSQASEYVSAINSLTSIDVSSGGVSLAYEGQAFTSAFFDDMKLSAPGYFGWNRAGFWELTFISPLP